VYTEMINNVVNFPQVPEVAPVSTPVVVPKEVVSVNSSEQTKSESHNTDTSGSQGQAQPPFYSLRLTVDKDPKTGEWVYKAIDRATGKVVRQLPRPELLQLRSSDSYTPGSVIKTDV